jgi:hypothetical protein
MDQTHTSSHKRTNRLGVPPNDCLCHCPCHDDHREHGPSSKRLKSDERLRALLPHSEAPRETIRDASSLNVFRDSFETYSQTNADSNPFADGFPVFPSLPSPGLQAYLRFDSQHENAGTANNTVEPSVSYTASDDTFSPRSMNRQVVLDTNDCTTQSPNVANEFQFDGSDDFSLESGNEWWDASSGNLPTFSGLGRRLFELVSRFLTILSWFRYAPYPGASNGRGQQCFVLFGSFS